MMMRGALIEADKKMKRLTPERVKEISREFDPPLGSQGFFSKEMIYELLCEIDALRAENRNLDEQATKYFNAMQGLCPHDDMDEERGFPDIIEYINSRLRPQDMQNEIDSIRDENERLLKIRDAAEDFMFKYRAERDALQLIVENQTGEILNLQSEIQYLQTERDSLKAELDRTRIEKTDMRQHAEEWEGYWKHAEKERDSFKAKWLEYKTHGSLTEMYETQKARILKLRASLEETGKDIVENAPDTIWTSDCISMTVVERIQSALAADVEGEND